MRIPDELWSAGIEVARWDGVNQTAPLHLDDGKLKRRMIETGPVPDKPMLPAFVEMTSRGRWARRSVRSNCWRLGYY